MAAAATVHHRLSRRRSGRRHSHLRHRRPWRSHRRSSSSSKRRLPQVVRTAHRYQVCLVARLAGTAHPAAMVHHPRLHLLHLRRHPRRRQGRLRTSPWRQRTCRACQRSSGRFCRHSTRYLTHVCRWLTRLGRERWLLGMLPGSMPCHAASQLSWHHSSLLPAPLPPSHPIPSYPPTALPVLRQHSTALRGWICHPLPPTAAAHLSAPGMPAVVHCTPPCMPHSQPSLLLPPATTSPARKREMDDNSRRLGGLFWKLNEGQVAQHVVAKLLQMVAALDAGNWPAAQHVQVRA